MAELTLAELRSRLGDVTVRDATRLRRRLQNLRGQNPAKLQQLADQIAAAQTLVANRRAAVPTIAYPDLPVSERRQEIAAAIRQNQVVVVAGETGSGKTTQLPKICLDVGRGVRGTIGHTQPRRLAARTVAQRIADELRTPLGDVVGYTVRFTDQVSDRTLIKLMTDGILLAEIQRDRRLLRYDTLILDEAHERSLNIDFLLGYLRDLLPRRPDLKVIVTSATIEPQRFAAHFGGAPIVEVSGRTYPVQIRYRPLEVPVAPDPDDDPDDPDREIVRTETRDEVEAIVDAIEELRSEPPGDVLVFLSGEREIRDTAEALAGVQRGPMPTEVLPLYARLPTAEQQKVFAPHTGRRVVLATNVAETSLTVPGIRYVVDPAMLASRATAGGSKCNGCRSSRSRRHRRRSGPVAAGGWRPVSVSGCIPRKTSPPDRTTPSRRYCGRIWQQCSCRWPRCSSVTSRTSRSSTHRTGAACATVFNCCRSSARSTSPAR